MKILSIDTSCDETAAAVTDGVKILSNVLWSQASLHASYGGVYPSLAKRAHEERIGWVVEKALKTASPKSLSTSYQLLDTKIDAIAVTVGPGLAIALEVGISKAKELARKFNKPLITVNHIEGHLFSPLAKPRTERSNFKFEIYKQFKNSKLKIQNLKFPALSLVASGKHTDLILVNSIGKYKIIASTIDDAIGEALDKAARMLGFGYPGGPILEKLAKDGDVNSYPLPIPMIGQEGRMEFSYSGLKTAMYKLIEKEKPLTRQKDADLAAAFQDKAFIHIERIFEKALRKYKVKDLFLGGGVSANIELRKRLRRITKKYGIKLWIPYSKKLCTDNAAMIGVAAYFKYERGELLTLDKLDLIDRLPRAKVDKPFPWEN